MTLGTSTRRWIVAVGATATAVLLVRAYAVQVYGITTPSMSPTLASGDYVITSRLPFGVRIPGTALRTPAARDPRHGEVVVYGEKAGDPAMRVIKRAVGLPGDTVGMRDGRVIRNGRVVEEPYASRPFREDEPLAFEGPYGVAWHIPALPAGVAAESYRPTRDNWGPLVVPEGQYLLLGDNRGGSRDSRVTGFVAREQIRGTVVAIYFSRSLDRMGMRVR